MISVLSVYARFHLSTAQARSWRSTSHRSHHHNLTQPSQAAHTSHSAAFISNHLTETATHQQHLALALHPHAQLGVVAAAAADHSH